ncbi:hypothetical protein LWI29_022860 [Acer saccharum]|uniref:Uncharacterized protein n=1 Tax=Acer saccharum TaxID=4024 RepID=A0AA39W7J0_ACESA|nr:hypothetical protein LWI29_022860 [Acer saccharum]
MNRAGVNPRNIPSENQGVGELSKVDGRSKRKVANGIGSEKTMVYLGKRDFDNRCDLGKQIVIIGEKSGMQNEMGLKCSDFANDEKSPALEADEGSSSCCTEELERGAMDDRRIVSS